MAALDGGRGVEVCPWASHPGPFVLVSARLSSPMVNPVRFRSVFGRATAVDVSGPRDQLRRELTRLCPVRPGRPHLPWAMRVRCRSRSPRQRRTPAAGGACAGSTALRERLDFACPASLSVALIRHAAISRRWPEGSSARRRGRSRGLFVVSSDGRQTAERSTRSGSRSER